MTERPILFSGEMVRAILAGRKTQTRRVIKHFDGSTFAKSPDYVRWQFHDGEDQRASYLNKWWAYQAASGGSALQVIGIRCPYGIEGDRLWVRERVALNMPRSEFKNGIAYYATDAARCSTLLTWRPSIHMPRRAARIILEVTDVRIERLQNISIADAQAEGVNSEMICEARPDIEGTIPPEAVTDGYRFLWDKINARRAPWDSNPWCWAVTFKVVA